MFWANDTIIDLLYDKINFTLAYRIIKSTDFVLIH